MFERIDARAQRNAGVHRRNWIPRGMTVLFPGCDGNPRDSGTNQPARRALKQRGVPNDMQSGVVILVVGSPWSGAPLITAALRFLGAALPSDHPGTATSSMEYLNGWRSPAVTRLNARMLRRAGRWLPDAGHIPDAFFTSSECERLRHHVDDFLEDELQSDSVLAIEGPEICSLKLGRAHV